MNDTVNQAKSVEEVLIAAKWILENVGWCQEDAVQLDEKGKPYAYCAYGALDTVEANAFHRQEAKNAFRRAIKNDCIVIWNDVPSNTKAKVLSAFDQAIQENKDAV